MRGCLHAVTAEAWELPWNRKSVGCLGAVRTALSFIQRKNGNLFWQCKPAWAGEMTVLVNGEKADCPVEKDIFLWRENGRMEMWSGLPWNCLLSKWKHILFVTADSGRVALLRGPLLYCIEEADNPEGTDVELGDEKLVTEESSPVRWHTCNRRCDRRRKAIQGNSLLSVE